LEAETELGGNGIARARSMNYAMMELRSALYRPQIRYCTGNSQRQKIRCIAPASKYNFRFFRK
jgi:hypothetical protein